MKKLLVMVIGAMAVGFAAPAFAGDGWYVDLGLAPAWIGSDFHYPDGSVLTPSTGTSVLIDGAAGYKWGQWRFEGDFFWTKSNAGTATVAGPLQVNPLIVNPAHPQIHGDIAIGGFMAGANYDFPVGDGWGVTLGVGLGTANVQPHFSTTNGLTLVGENHFAFAWRLLGGVTYALRPDLDLQVDYRYTGIGDTGHDVATAVVNPLAVNPFVNGVIDHHTNVQALMFGLRWFVNS